MTAAHDPTRADAPRAAVFGGPRMVFAAWLRAARQARNLTLAEVARTTKIQVRLLERLEAGNLDQLPAEVFVRGFIRSYARCVGADEKAALVLWAECAADVTSGASTDSHPSPSVVRVEVGAPSFLRQPSALGRSRRDLRHRRVRPSTAG